VDADALHWFLARSWLALLNGNCSSFDFVAGVLCTLAFVPALVSDEASWRVVFAIKIVHRLNQYKTTN
jgi:hypothetical protein